MVLCVENFGCIYPWIWILCCQENLTAPLVLVFVFKLNRYQQLLSELFIQRPPRKTLFLIWNQKHGLSQHMESRGEPQLVRVTGKRHKEELGHRMDHGAHKLVNRVPRWPGVPGFHSDSQDLEVWTWSERERFDKIQLAFNYMPL